MSENPFLEDRKSIIVPFTEAEYKGILIAAELANEKPADWIHGIIASRVMVWSEAVGPLKDKIKEKYCRIERSTIERLLAEK